MNSGNYIITINYNNCLPINIIILSKPQVGVLIFYFELSNVCR